jgi:hypothetical protein
MSRTKFFPDKFDITKKTDKGYNSKRNLDYAGDGIIDVKLLVTIVIDYIENI